jgi:hypothetical protein
MGTPYTYQRQAKRTYSGIVPALYDKIDVGYPTDTREVYTYSLYNENTNSYLVTAIIEITYTDATKDFISTVEKTYNAPEA